MSYSIVIEKRAIADIQQAMDYYNSQQVGSGDKLMSVIDKHIQAIGENPFFQIRYNHVRCLPLKKFPFMIHFVIDEKRGLLM